MKRGLFVFVMVAMLGLLLPMGSAGAQDDPTPTPTPTVTLAAPSSYAMVLDSGNELTVIRSFTFGEIGITIGLGIIAILLLISILSREAREWLR